VPYLLVPIEGDATRAARLLAAAGIQNLVKVPEPTADGTESLPIAVARLQASDAPSALDRVRAALREEPFTVEGAVSED
jgi:hypothetical protein